MPKDDLTEASNQEPQSGRVNGGTTFISRPIPSSSYSYVSISKQQNLVLW
ncbi:hypothetical protein N9L64_00865 [Flavobacteriaceae bacterium]|nr:hypothetical protein [Flavobacteriaceae bacterium]